MPGQGSMFYLSQRPYLVTGSLRDQILYPWPPQGLLEEATAKPRHRRSTGTPRTTSARETQGERVARDFSHMAPAQLDEYALDARLEAALEAVELDYLLGRY